MFWVRSKSNSSMAKNTEHQHFMFQLRKLNVSFVPLLFHEREMNIPLINSPKQCKLCWCLVGGLIMQCKLCWCLMGGLNNEDADSLTSCHRVVRYGLFILCNQIVHVCDYFFHKHELFNRIEWTIQILPQILMLCASIPICNPLRFCKTSLNLCFIFWVIIYILVVGW